MLVCPACLTPRTVHEGVSCRCNLECRAEDHATAHNGQCGVRVHMQARQGVATTSCSDTTKHIAPMYSASHHCCKHAQQVTGNQQLVPHAWPCARSVALHISITPTHLATKWQSMHMHWALFLTSNPLQNMSAAFNNHHAELSTQPPKDASPG